MDTFTVLLIMVGDRLYDLPLPRMRRAKRALPVLNEAIHTLIREHRTTGGDRGDLLSMLLAARDTEGDGSGMSDEQIRDEVMTLVLAGHETTANALAWTWWFLAQHPDVESRLYAELDAVLGEVDVPSMAHLPSLPYTRAVLAESMRLRPPVYATSREVVGDFALNGIPFPLGTQVMVSQWVTQRDPRWWDEPERFDPSRWLDGREAGRHKFAYFPFIAGTRVCVGEQFAWTEGVLVLASIARRWRLKLTVPPSAVGHYAAVTLRPHPGVPVELEERKR
jgi:cytochrome P450